VTITYQFAAQLAEGESYETQIDAFFRSNFNVQISAVDRTTQRRGIDRVWYDVKDDRTWTVEYKADSLAGKTGNAFIETISVDTTGKLGWAYTSQASLLVYLVTEPQTVYVISMARLRRCLPRWRAAYPTRQAANDGYNTHGLLVPLHELERIAAAVY
jgi:hypothetical protein